MLANIVECRRLKRLYARLRIPNQVAYPPIEDPPHYFVELQLGRSVGINSLDIGEIACEHRHAFVNLLECEQVRFVAVIEVGSRVGQLVSPVDQLSFEWRPLIKQI